MKLAESGVPESTLRAVVERIPEKSKFTTSTVEQLLIEEGAPVTRAGLAAELLLARLLRSRYLNMPRVGIYQRTEGWER